MDTQKLDKILKLKQKGLSLREIGALVKMSPEGVRNAINKYGWIRGGRLKVNKNKNAKRNLPTQKRI